MFMEVSGFLYDFRSAFCNCFPVREENSEAVMAKESSSSELKGQHSKHAYKQFENHRNKHFQTEKISASPLLVPPSPSKFSKPQNSGRLEPAHLHMSKVLKATQNFSPSLKIGEGVFGTVYKAHLQDGQVVSIKRAKKEHFEASQTEFSTEVDLLSKTDHLNLVKILGSVNEGKERLIITEYVPNGTLREHLDGQHGTILDFSRRLEISIDVAHALTYLHSYAEKSIIHRDVKSSNILLTESLKAKVADFGFARVGPMGSDRTHISTKVKGTLGYLDPEYMRTFRLTTKSDVYSFGILLIEILTGRRPVEPRRASDERVTLIWEAKPKRNVVTVDSCMGQFMGLIHAWNDNSYGGVSVPCVASLAYGPAFKMYNDKNSREMMDPLLEETVSVEILDKIFGLALHCAAPVRTKRPDMKWVGEQLWAIRMDYFKSVNRA